VSGADFTVVFQILICLSQNADMIGMSAKVTKFKKSHNKLKKQKLQVNTSSNLTIRQQKFVDCYDGDIKKAAKKAKLNYCYCRQLLTKPNILEIIRNRENTEIRPKAIATRQERQEFWTKVLQGKIGKKVKMSDRLKASELLGKSEADFMEKVHHSGDINNPMASLTPAERLACLRESLLSKNNAG
jgi:phage terminase small subunit